MKTEKSFLNRFIFVLIGHMIIGLGVGLFMHSGLGADPNGVLISGVGKQINANYGVSSMILNALIIVIIFFVDKRYINVASLLGIFSIGYTADFVMMILRNIIPNPASSLAVQIPLLVFGGLFMGIGIVIYIDQKIGIAAFDAISEIVANKTNTQFGKVRVAMDTAALVIGFFIGGIVGPGTVYLALTTGPIVNTVRKILNVEPPMAH